MKQEKIKAQMQESIKENVVKKAIEMAKQMKSQTVPKSEEPVNLEKAAAPLAKNSVSDLTRGLLNSEFELPKSPE